MNLDDDAKQRLKWALEEINADTRDMTLVFKAFEDEKLVVLTESDYHDLLDRANG